MIRVPGGTSEVRVLLCEVVYSGCLDASLQCAALRAEELTFFWLDAHRLLVVYEPQFSHVVLDRASEAVRRWSGGMAAIGDVDFLLPRPPSSPPPPAPPLSRREEAERKMYRAGFHFGRAIRRYLKEL